MNQVHQVLKRVKRIIWNYLKGMEVLGMVRIEEDLKDKDNEVKIYWNQDMEKMEYKAMVVYQRELQDLFETAKKLRSLYDLLLGKAAGVLAAVLERRSLTMADPA